MAASAAFTKFAGYNIPEKINPFKAIIPFSIFPEKNKNTSGFLLFLGGKLKEYCSGMG